jgi:hypothetical protein
MMRPDDIDALRQKYRYDSDSGLFYRLEAFGDRCPAGSVSGNVSGRGYLYLYHKNKSYLAHRVAFAFINGRWPEFQIDHINGDKLDNRACNLREASHSQNLFNQRVKRNSTSGVKGVFPIPKGRWRAEIKAHGKVYRLGHYDTIDEAASAYEKAAQRLHGEFARVA